MKWIKWSEDTLPEPKQRVLICYKSGLVGAIEFFYSQEAKESHIKGMMWNKENPISEMGMIGNSLREFYESDPIIAWMPCPDPPSEYWRNYGVD